MVGVVSPAEAQTPKSDTTAQKAEATKAAPPAQKVEAT